jgi:hypothetical protein
MILNHRDFPGKRSALKSIEIQGDSLLWSYQSGFFTQNASVPISSLVSIRLENNELIWTYRLFANDGSGKVDDIAEILSAIGQTQSDNDCLVSIYWNLLEFVNPREFTERRTAEHDSRRRSSRKHNSKTSEDFGGDDSAYSANNQQRRDPSNAGSSSESSRGQSASQSSSSGPPGTRDDLKRALSLIGGSLAKEKKRKLKSTLRLVHHPDHGGNHEFFIQLESVLVELEW